MNEMGHVLNFNIDFDEITRSINIGPGSVQLANGMEVRYAGGKTVTGLEPGVYRVFIADGKLMENMKDRPGPYTLALRKRDEYQVEVDHDLVHKRGAYSGGLVVICNDLKVPGTVGKQAEANMIETMGLMARVIAEMGKPKFGAAGNVNVNQIALHLEAEAKKLDLGRGFGEATLRKRLTEALGALKTRMG